MSRRFILKVLLASLALAAAAGVSAVLLPARDVMVRVMFTGFATAVSAGIVLPLSRMIDVRRLRTAGLFGISVVIAEFIMMLGLIWLEPAFSSRTFEKLGVTALMVALCGAGGLAYLVLTASPRSRPAGAVGLATGALALAGFLTAIWLPGYPTAHDNWWETGWTAGGFGLLMVIALVGNGWGRPRWWCWAGVSAAAVAAVLILLDVWRRVENDELISVFAGAAAWVAFAHIVLLLPLRGAQVWVRRGTLLAAAACVVFIDLFVITDAGHGDTLLGRLISASGIVTGCGAVALLVLAAINRRGEMAPETAVMVEMDVTCPRCRRRQRVPLGDSACSACGLRFRIRIEEPRCPRCDYLLYRIESDRCPECGLEIEPALPRAGLPRAGLPRSGSPRRHGEHGESTERGLD